MSANKVVSSSFIKKVANGGRSIDVKFATKTDAWKRTQLSQEVKDAFADAVQKADVPTGATAAVLSETEHPSKKDSYPHYTTHWQDANGNHVTTKHVYPTK
ncbi:hypothetical protein EJ02DRAFT_385082 [Clathrospora elynae]|uniref:Uncharacterized protein n=2 Tax=Pleosporales TaxID=92860 RepID=A0A6A5SAY3_9PLEO|nr:hypothetical protein EJ02DRAFT_385082 [Clathrospora elynae]KAG9195642.1 hypothetical protein G6011_00763 [Alternaria panax]